MVMNKLQLIMKFLLSFVLVIAVCLTGCASGKKHESTGEFFDDTVLTTKVKASILADSRLKVLQIDVETYKGVVQLSGFVDTTEGANRAVEMARRVRGVKMVNNSLIVK
ncbi:putative periplasmic or secreted lipoprotein [Crenothrix polyspora]|uniref:Putative periplasmic or secreted lipoprotein n=2 Tax=Crenothrix polyspora TaxID=360316 RepID=A0A1R4HD28_9GAMM|nr:putative periplasmic or secreted lipoprotein [Crenothrix polyspora]